MSLLIQLCDDYLHDRLGDAERKAFEERIAKGDKELIETLYQLKSFGKSRKITEQDELSEEQNTQSQLLQLVQEGENEAQNPREQHSGPQASLADDLQTLEARKKKSSKSLFLVLLGFMFIGLIAFVTYQQWNTLSLTSKVSVLEKQVDALQTERTQIHIQNRDILFNLERIKALVSGDFFTTSKMTLKNNRGSWIQLWDRGTLRTMVILDKPQFNEGEILQLWSRNARTRDWQLVGAIDQINADSLYTQWDAQMLGRSMGLQVKLISTEQKDQIIGEIKLNHHD